MQHGCCNDQLLTNKFYIKCKDQLLKANFTLHKFELNSLEREQMINRKVHELSITKIFGLQWDKINDTIISDIKKLETFMIIKPTNIQFFASIYDPLGLINSFVVSFKCLFQQVCISKVNWDALLSRDILKVWHNIILELRSSNRLVVPRWYGNINSAKRVELNGFSDASIGAYGCCIYIQITGQDGSIHLSLATSKSPVSPIKQMSILKLELQGPMLLAHVIILVHLELPSFIHVSSIHCWCDSMIVLHWFNVDGKKQGVFVKRRVEDVHKLVAVDCWYYVKTKLYPADILSRDLRYSELFDNDLWFQGPSTILLDDVPYDRFSLKNLVFKNDTVLMNISMNNPVDLKFMNIEKFCTCNKILRVTVYEL